MGFHAHEGFEISVVLEGKGHFESRDSQYRLEAGHVLFIPTMLPHAFRAETDIRFGVLEAENMPEDTLRLFKRLREVDHSLIYRLSPIVLEEYEGLFRYWLRMIAQNAGDEQRMHTAWVDVLLLYLLEHTGSGSTKLTIAESAEYIRSNLRSELKITEIARQCGLSESAYRSLFRAAHHLSPKQYQMYFRNQEAKWLLRTTNRTIKQIAEQVGFSDIHAFSSWFKRKEGMYPTDWRGMQSGYAATGSVFYK